MGEGGNSHSVLDGKGGGGGGASEKLRETFTRSQTKLCKVPKMSDPMLAISMPVFRVAKRLLHIIMHIPEFISSLILAQSGSKTLPFVKTHTFIVHIRKCPLHPPPRSEFLRDSKSRRRLFILTSIFLPYCIEKLKTRPFFDFLIQR